MDSRPPLSTEVTVPLSPATGGFRGVTPGERPQVLSTGTLQHSQLVLPGPHTSAPRRPAQSLRHPQGGSAAIPAWGAVRLQVATRAMWVDGSTESVPLNLPSPQTRSSPNNNALSEAGIKVLRCYLCWS